MDDIMFDKNAYVFVDLVGTDEALDAIKCADTGYINFNNNKIDVNAVNLAINDIVEIKNMGGINRANEIISRGVYKFGTLVGTNHEHIPQVLKRITSSLGDINYDRS